MTMPPRRAIEQIMDPAPLGLVLEGWALVDLLPPPLLPLPVPEGLEELLPPLPPLPPLPLAEADGLAEALLPLSVAEADGLACLQRSLIFATKALKSLGKFFSQPKHLSQGSIIEGVPQAQSKKFCTAAVLLRSRDVGSLGL